MNDLSIAPERLIRASLIQILFSVRSERHLTEQMQYNLLFRWCVGLGIDDPAWVAHRRHSPNEGFLHHVFRGLAVGAFTEPVPFEYSLQVGVKPD